MRASVQNFDEVLVPADHVSRSPNDTYYIDTDTVLRCHTSAHQAATLRQGKSAFLITGAGTPGMCTAWVLRVVSWWSLLIHFPVMGAQGHTAG